MPKFSVSFYMFKDRDMIPEFDDAYIDFYDPFDEYNPFCEKNFVLTEELDAPAVEKAFSVVGLKWGAKYGDEAFAYSHYPFAKTARRDVIKWWREVEAEVKKTLSEAHGTEFYDRIAQGAVSRKYKGLTGDMWNVYGMMSGETLAGRMESRFQVLSKRLSGRGQFFLPNKPNVSFCAFRIG